MKIAEKFASLEKFNVDETVDYSIKGITEICDEIGPRAPGSPEELKAQEKMAGDLKQWADEVDIEGFTVHPQAFLGFVPFTVLMGILGNVCFWTDRALVGLILVIIGMIPLILEFVMYKQFIDPLFLGHTSHNVIAKRKCTGEAKKRIIFVGHADSQYEWTINYKLGGVGMKCVLIPAVVGLFVSAIANLLKWILFDLVQMDNLFTKILLEYVGFYALIIFVPFMLAFLFFQNPFKNVPGANDNLTGCYASMGVLKLLDEADVRFENTEVWAILSGSEESGLRGAKAYAKAHEAELKEIETVVIAVDTLRDIDDLYIYDRDLSGTLKHDSVTRELVREAGKNCGFDLKNSSVYIGASDAAAFTQHGIRSTCLAAMDPTPPRYYHTRLDAPDMLVPEAMKIGISIMVETACVYDSEGLKK